MRSNPSRTPMRLGFTLVELLVVIAIIGILVALLLPAIQAAREAGRRMSCSNKLHNIGIALHNYHDVHQSFPADAVWNRRGKPPAMTAGEERHFTWICLILPFMEQKPLHDQINFSIPLYNQTLQGGELVRAITLDTFLCPSDTTFKSLPHGLGYTSYAGSQGWSGYRYSYGDERLTGIFPVYDNYGIRDVRDGTANTVMVAEVTNRSVCCTPAGQWQGGRGRPRVGTGEPVFRTLLFATSILDAAHPWYDPVGGPLLRGDGSSGSYWGPWGGPHGMPPVYWCHWTLNTEWPGPASQHPSGGLFALCDGSVRFISESINTGQGVPALGIGVGDPWGRGGNIFSGMHYPQGIPEKSPIVFD